MSTAVIVKVSINAWHGPACQISCSKTEVQRRNNPINVHSELEIHLERKR